MHETPAALVPTVVGAGRPVRPRAESTWLGVGQETVVVPEAGVGVAAGAEAAPVGRAVAADDDVEELLLAPPQAASASEHRTAATAAKPRREGDG